MGLTLRSFDDGLYEKRVLGHSLGDQQNALWYTKSFTVNVSTALFNEVLKLAVIFENVFVELDCLVVPTAELAVCYFHSLPHFTFKLQIIT